MMKMLACTWMALVPMAAAAQDTTRVYALDEVVVTGQYEAQSVAKSVYQVRTIPVEQFVAKGATTLQDVLNTQLTLRFSQDMALGTSSMMMNGLPAQYIKVLIDGIPVVGKSSGNEINLNQINVNMIERIEIVDGPMAVAYGADALAGVINIITKKPAEHRVSIQARVQEETVGREYGTSKGVHNQYVAGAISGKKWYGRLEAGHLKFFGWKGNQSGRERQWHPKTQWLGGGMAGVRTEKIDVYYRLDVMDEEIYNPGEFQGNQALDQRYIVKRFMHQVQGNAIINDRLSFNGAAAYTDYARKTQSVNVDRETGKETLSLGDGQQDKTTFQGMTARGTFQYKLRPRITIQPGYDVNIEDGSGGRLKEGVHQISDYAAFLSAEFIPNRFVSVRPGVRTMYNSQYDAPPLVYALNTKFIITKNLDFRLSYGRGFRAPSLRELYFDFFDANHAIEGNPDLEPEQSNSVNSALNWTSSQKDQQSLTHTLSAFYNDIDNMISTGYRPSNTTVTTYVNVLHYKSKGVVWTNRYRYKSLNVSAGLSYLGQYNQFQKDAQHLPAFTWSREVMTTVAYSFKKLGLSANVFYKYTGELPYYEVSNTDGATHLAKIHSYHWCDVSARKEILRYVSVMVGVRNLFDVVSIQNSTVNSGSAHSGGSVNQVGPGRSYFMTLAFALDR